MVCAIVLLFYCCFAVVGLHGDPHGDRVPVVSGDGDSPRLPLSSAHPLAAATGWARRGMCLEAGAPVRALHPRLVGPCRAAGVPCVRWILPAPAVFGPICVVFLILLPEQPSPLSRVRPPPRLTCRVFSPQLGVQCPDPTTAH